MLTVAELLGASLRGAGVARVFGQIAVPGITHVRVDDAALATLLADADGRLGPGPGAALVESNGGTRVRLSSRPGGAPAPMPPHLAEVTDVRALPDAIVHAASLPTHSIAACDLGIALDLDAPVPFDVAPAGSPHLPTPPMSHSLGARSMVVLAGPEVVRQNAIEGLRAFAEAAHVGVANTWGAKGVFPWNSEHHLGTCGLQARDFELLGLADVELVVTTGLDADETRPPLPSGSRVVDVPPPELARSASLATPRETISSPELFTRLSQIVLPGYRDAAVPLHPARAINDAREALPDGALVTGGADVAGFWLARAFPTTAPGSVVVPATRAAGVAVALALCAALAGRRALAMTRAPVDDTTASVLDLARSLDASFVVDVWDDDAPRLSIDAHRAQLDDALTARGLHVVHVPVDVVRTQELVDVAGPIVAWGGLAPA